MNGFSGKTLGTDYEVAALYVEAQNAEWDGIKQAAHEIETARGNMDWLIKRFEKDPVYYGERAPATQDEIDCAFRYIRKKFGPAPISAIKRRHCKAWYNELRGDFSAHKAKKIIKWLHRLFAFSIDLEARDDNPASNLKMTTPPPREQIWTRQEIAAVIESALAGGVANSGNMISPRPSVALATLIAYDTSLPQGDILALTWHQFDGEGLSVQQKKKRGGNELWIPLSEPTLDMLGAQARISTHIIVSEETGQPYPDKNVFGRIFRRFRDRADVRADLTFHDIRRTALSEMGNMGATNTENISFSGHKLNSRVLSVYVRPNSDAARNARNKRRIAEVPQRSVVPQDDN